MKHRIGKQGLTLLAAAVIVGLVVSRWVGFGNKNESSIKVTLPTSFTSDALEGRALFEANCKTCHGLNASGTNAGPPLVHKIYEPSHHGDISFQRAAKFGVQSHHWRYGNMPSVPTVDRGDVEKIIAYVREIQRANGIE